MDHVHNPEEDANEERSVKADNKRWSVLDSVDKAIGGSPTISKTRSPR